MRRGGGGGTDKHTKEIGMRGEREGFGGADMREREGGGGYGRRRR